MLRNILPCPCRTRRCRLMQATRVLAVAAGIAWNLFLLGVI